MKSIISFFVILVGLLYPIFCCSQETSGNKTGFSEAVTFSYVPKVFYTSDADVEYFWPVLDLQYEHRFTSLFSYVLQGSYWNAGASHFSLLSYGGNIGLRCYLYKTAIKGAYLGLGYSYQDIQFAVRDEGVSRGRISDFSYSLGYQWVFDNDMAVNVSIFSNGKARLSPNDKGKIYEGGLSGFETNIRAGLGYAW